MEKKLFYSAIYLPFLPFFSLYSSIYLSFFLTFFLSLSSIYLSSFLIPPPTHSFKEQTSLSLWVCVSGSCRARTNEKPSSLVRRAYRSFYLPSYLALPKHWNWAVQIWWDWAVPCGSVGRAVASKTRDPRFDSSYQRFFIEKFFFSGLFLFLFTRQI